MFLFISNCLFARKCDAQEEEKAAKEALEKALLSLE
jgi:hypothetical protein